MSTTETEGPTTEQQRLQVVEGGNQPGSDDPSVTREQMLETVQESPGVVCPECNKPLKNRNTLSQHMRVQHGRTLTGRSTKAKPKPLSKEKPQASTYEKFNEALGKLIFPDGIPVQADPNKTRAMVDAYITICEDAWNLRKMTP